MFATVGADKPALSLCRVRIFTVMAHFALKECLRLPWGVFVIFNNLTCLEKSCYCCEIIISSVIIITGTIMFYSIALDWIGLLWIVL